MATLTMPEHDMATTANNNMNQLDNSNKKRKVTYEDIINGCKDLIRTIQGDEEIMLSVLASVNEWTNNIRSNRTVNVSFSNQNQNLDRNCTQRQDSIVPIPSVITAPQYANRDRRFKSSNEHYRRTIKPTNRPTSLLCGDVGFISINQKSFNYTITKKYQKKRRFKKLSNMFHQRT